jgi:hypothetical protein
MVVYRTAANPATLDLALDPSDRDVGTIVGGRPELGNHHILGLGRVVSPRTWLTYWSGVSSTWGFLHAAPSVETPLLFISAAGDSDILPADADAMWAATRGADRTRHDLRGADHYLRPTSQHRGPPPRETALALITEWIDKRWPPIST